MDKIVQLPLEEYIALFNSLKGNLRVVSTEIGIDPYDSKEERARKVHKAFNPDLPMFIKMNTIDGVVHYCVGKNE